MPSEMFLKVGDLLPEARQTLLGPDGAPIDLTDVTTITFRMRAYDADVLKINGAAAKLNAPGVDGKVRYAWTGTDTDTEGLYFAEWHLVFSDGRPMTVPNDSDVLVGIAPSVANAPRLDPGTLAAMRRWVGSSPGDMELAVAFARCTNVHAVALEILEARLADFLTEPTSLSIVGHGSQDVSSNIEYLREQIGALKVALGGRPGGLATARLVRRDRGRPC